MPRVRGAAPSAPEPSPFKAPIKIPLNDDRQEKAKRFQSRQAFHNAQLDSIKAAASPVRKRKSFGPNGDGPHTPQQGDEQDFLIGGSAVTPMKRVPILANFEEWMKMATDNKINATNSWNFALIDYFHDMSLLREGDSVNFQKASCTLDGCVKIYTSRVDSVATETGKLLSGLADSGNKKSKGTEDGADGEDEDEEGDDGMKKKSRKKAQRSEATLATSFAQLQLKKMELEFSVDPLFKKASADFDEGGAKGLLLNHLCIDNTGRIVFDSSDDAQDEIEDASKRDSMLQESEDGTRKEHVSSTQLENAPVDIAGLGARFFPDLTKLDSQDICPSLKTFELGSGTGTLDLPFLKAAEDWRKEKGKEEEEEQEEDANDDARSGIVLDDDNAMGFDDDDLGGFDLPPETGFGEGGEVWAKEAHIAPQIRPHTLGPDDPDGAAGEDGEVGTFDANGKHFGVTLIHRPSDEQENILSYFDTALAKNWAGPEHWKIKKVKDAAKAAPAEKKRKEKEPFEIDFLAPMTQQMADLLYTSAPTNASISLPKSQWKSRTRNLLPDDKHFNSKDLLRLFLKPKARMGARKSGSSRTWATPSALPDGEVDEAYWAAQQVPDIAPPSDDVPGDYDANFFNDDNLPLPGGGDDDVFDDAPELLPPISDEVDAAGGPPPGSHEGTFGSQLVTQSRRLRPEYVQYARVAKKVDVRRLKEEMWLGTGFEKSTQLSPSKQPTTVSHTEDGVLKFTDVVNNLQTVYPKQAMEDISTSYCFICLLHLANEKGLVIENQEGWQELTVRRDFAAEITGE